MLDELLPAVRSRWDVSARGADTIVSGQSLGGIAALWTLALSRGEVGHAIAQSPSLWRFDVAATLLDAPEWRSVVLQVGSFEGEMLADAEALAKRLCTDARGAGRCIEMTPLQAGHDWGAWRVGLLHALADRLKATPNA